MLFRKFSTLQFLKDLHTFLKQKFHILQGLYCLAQQTPQISCATKCLNMLKDGAYLHEALALFPKQFDPIVIMFIRVGELSGRLPDTLMCAITYLDFKNSLKQKSLQLLFYPLILLIVLFGVLYSFVHLIIPQLETSNLGCNTKSLYVVYFALNTLLIFFLFLGTFGIICSLVPQIIKKTNCIIFKIPFIGSTYYNLQSAYFLKILAILLTAKIPTVFVFESLEATIPFQKIKKQYQACSIALKLGQPLGQVLSNISNIKNMIVIGSDDWIKKIDDIAETQLHTTQERMTIIMRIIEPLTLLLTGGILVMIILTVFNPLYDHLHAIN